MSTHLFRKSLRWRWARIWLILFLSWNFLDVFHVHRTLSLQRPSLGSDALAKRPKIFVASTHWNNEAVLRSHWNRAVLDLAKYFGPENIYVSVYESGSWDNSKDVLRDLNRDLEQLGVNSTFVLDKTTHSDEIGKPVAQMGWIDTPRGEKELRRIPYLSKLRNKSLQPLEELAAIGSRFDKILFLNDVVFTTADVLTLLNTNDGVYAAACALDFSKPPYYYDTFALRDSDGAASVMQTWPYFRAQRSRHAIKRGSPVPVKSCWNGMVSMPTRPFYALPTPLRFRGVHDTLAHYHLEGSECCLIHADNDMSPKEGVWLNPQVRVGYNGPAYDNVHPESSWVSFSDIFFGIWKNRLRRWTTTTWFKDIRVGRRLRAWKKTSDAELHEPGRYCLINEMQVLISNGWAHV